MLHKNDTISGILAKMKPFEKVPLEFLKAPNPLDSTATRIPVALSLDVKGSDAMLDLIPPLKIHGEAPTNALVKDCARRLNGRVTTIVSSSLPESFESSLTQQMFSSTN